MSYTIIYDKKFVKTAHGIIPIVLSGDNNLYDTNSRGQQVCVRSWVAFSYTPYPTSAEELMAEVHNSLPSHYNQHFKYSSRWVDDKGLVNFFASGIRNALTLEEMTQKYIVYGLSVELLVNELGTGQEYPPMRSAFSKPPHNASKNSEVPERVVVTHPFHPDSGKEFAYVGLTKKRDVRYVRCIDSTGKLTEFPVGSTNLNLAPVRSGESSCVASIDDLLALKSLIDAILLARLC